MCPLVLMKEIFVTKMPRMSIKYEDVIIVNLHWKIIDGVVFHQTGLLTSINAVTLTQWIVTCNIGRLVFLRFCLKKSVYKMLYFFFYFPCFLGQEGKFIFEGGRESIFCGIFFQFFSKGCTSPRSLLWREVRTATLWTWVLMVFAIMFNM